MLVGRITTQIRRRRAGGGDDTTDAIRAIACIYLADLSFYSNVKLKKVVKWVADHLAYLSFYSHVKQAAKRAIVGADAIYQNLRRFFPCGGGGSPPTP